MGFDIKPTDMLLIGGIAAVALYPSQVADALRSFFGRLVLGESEAEKNARKLKEDYDKYKGSKEGQEAMEPVVPPFPKNYAMTPEQAVDFANQYSSSGRILRLEPPTLEPAPLFSAEDPAVLAKKKGGYPVSIMPIFSSEKQAQALNIEAGIFAVSKLSASPSPSPAPTPPTPVPFTAADPTTGVAGEVFRFNYSNVPTSGPGSQLLGYRWGIPIFDVPGADVSNLQGKTARYRELYG